MLTTLLTIVFFLGMLAGGISMYLVGLYLKAQFEAEAEKRNQVQPGATTLARIREVGVDEALRERVKRNARLN
jgi:membrane protein DedA with SNARE-associated domain